ncbi:MAG: response regulator [Candidatus Aureabacteria bacterium]|nr:response regulator [Candidatus Auribacterota bacterium]
MAKKILIADDDLHIVHMLANRLRKNNYDIVVASDGMQAIMMAHNENPDLILLDFNMPGGRGSKVFENLQTSSKTVAIPVIFITAYPSEDIKEQVMGKGAFDFISKPFDSEELLSKIRKALGE